MFYELKVKVTRENAKGEPKQVSERYIMDCELFAEVEAKAFEEFGNDADVFFIARSKIKEIVNQKEICNPFFKATVVDVITDDEGEEKELKEVVLVCAKNIADATKKMEEYLRQGFNMKLDGIVKTKILDLL